MEDATEFWAEDMVTFLIGCSFTFESALQVDVAGGIFGLLPPAGADHVIAGGDPGTPVWHELTATTSVAEVVDVVDGRCAQFDRDRHAGACASLSAVNADAKAALEA